MIDLYRKTHADDVENIYRARSKSDVATARFTTMRNSVSVLHGRYEIHISVPDDLADRLLAFDAEYDGGEVHYWVRCDRLIEEHFVKLM